MVMPLLIAFVVLVIASRVISIAPPHPHYLEEYKRRRKLSGSFSSLNNQTSRQRDLKLESLHPLLCNDLTDYECRRLDQNYKAYTDSASNVIRSTGVLRSLVLLVQFSDHVDRQLPSRDDIQALWTAGEGESLDILPTASIREFIRKNSYDNLLIDADVFDWTVTDNSELFYSKGMSGLSDDLAACMYPALQVVDALGTDFSRYDLDGNGVIDSLVVLHSGFPAEIGGNDCYNNRPPEQRIWSHAIGSLEHNWTSNDGQYTLGGYMVASSLRGICGSDLARIGVMAHEFVHTWGIPDLYDTSGEWIGKGAGTFDIMSNPYGLDGAQTHPNNMGPWVKMQSGWLDPIEITQDGEYFAEASALNPSIYIIRDQFPSKEYLLIENRQPIGWDELLWGGGLLIWHIDDNAEGNSRRGYPGQYGWPGNGNHYGVAIANCDRNYDLEKGTNNGDETDFWVAGNELAPGLFEFEATDFSKYPNTNSYMLGRIFPTGLRIYDISQSGTVMSFKVDGVTPAPPPTHNPSWSPTPPPTRLPTWAPSLSPTRRPPGFTPIHALPSTVPTLRPTTAPVESLAPSVFAVLDDVDKPMMPRIPTSPLSPSMSQLSTQTMASPATSMRFVFISSLSIFCTTILCLT